MKYFCTDNLSIREKPEVCAPATIFAIPTRVTRFKKVLARVPNDCTIKDSSEAVNDLGTRIVLLGPSIVLRLNGNI